MKTSFRSFPYRHLKFHTLIERMNTASLKKRLPTMVTRRVLRSIALVLAIVCGITTSWSQPTPTSTPTPSVFSWGFNSSGQVGDGTITQRASPVPFGGLYDGVTVASGVAHNVALRSDGSVWTCGYNAVGQLGIGNTADQHSPVPVTGVPSAISVSAGAFFSLAIASDRTVWAWGRDGSGELGDGGGTNKLSPVQIASLSNVAQVSGGGDHALALLADGSIWAWGEGDHGQLGNGSFPTVSVPVHVLGLTGCVAVSAGGAHSLALRSDGTVWAWGYDFYGQLGDNGFADSPLPIQVPGLTNVVSIAAGDLHSLAVKSDGTVWAWGYNHSGQLGDGTTNGHRTPQQVQDLAEATMVGSGPDSENSYAVLQDGTLWSWGANGAATIGDGTTTDRHLPVTVASLHNVRAISGGLQQAIALADTTQQPLALATAASRKIQGSAGTFNVDLPLSGSPGVECRNSGGDHTLVFTFDNPVVSGSAAVTSGVGTVAGAPTFSGNTMTVELTGVADVQKITVTLSNVTDIFSQVLADTPASVNMLIGDTTGNKTVNATDIGQTKGQSGRPVTSANFRNDINSSGTITASDVAQVKANAGHTLP